MEATRASLEQRGLEAVFGQVSSPIGEGFSTELVQADGNWIHTEFFQQDQGNWLLYKLLGPADDARKTLREYAQARGTLQRL